MSSNSDFLYSKTLSIFYILLNSCFVISLSSLFFIDSVMRSLNSFSTCSTNKFNYLLLKNLLFWLILSYCSETTFKCSIYSMISL